MKNSSILRLGGAALSTAFLLSLAPSSRADLIYYITLNVASLTSNPAAPFSLDLQLSDGSGNGDTANTVKLSQFQFLGGSDLGPLFTSGGASGSTGSTVTLTNSGFDNELAEEFSATTSSITFKVDQTLNTDVPVQDQFSVAIQDNGGYNISTTDPSTGNTMVLSTINTAESLGSVNVYSSTGVANADSTVASGATASVSAVPEPGSAAMLILGAFGFLSRRQTFRRASRA